MTLEELQAERVRLLEENKKLIETNKLKEEETKKLIDDNNKLKEINQKYYERSISTLTEDEQKIEPKAPPLDDFVSSLKSNIRK